MSQIQLEPPKEYKENKQKSVDSNPIYKLKLLVNNICKSVYVFYGSPINQNEKSSIIQTIFTPEELDDLKSNNVSDDDIYFSENQIFLDDSIGVIKLKILNEIKNISIGEIYLFSQKVEILNAVSVFQILTQNNKIELTNTRLEQFVSNIVSNIDGQSFPDYEKKDVYDFDDILAMNFDGGKFIMNNVIGQKFFVVENEYPFVCNPFKVESYDPFLERTARKTLSTLNSNLLLNSGEIINNTIYLCLTEDVLRYMNKKGISEDATIKIYYPFLYAKKIRNLDDLRESKQELISEDETIYNTKTLDNLKSVDLFYKIYQKKTTNLNYISSGVKYIKAILKPTFSIKIPLEVIFKILHATLKNPLIKYNPSSRLENVYRLYADKISTDGRKIPFLKKTTIFKLMKTIGKTKSVSVFIDLDNNDVTNSVICEFSEKGYITFSSEFKKVMQIDDLNNLFRETLNPIIKQVTSILEQSGYNEEKGFNLNMFDHLQQENIEIVQMIYESRLSVTKPINIKKYKGCVSSVFNNETDEYKSGIHLRFKRVSNFNKTTSQEAFILEKRQQGLYGDEIIDALLDNFKDDLTREKAIELIAKVANEIQVQKGVRKGEIKIKDNPGFKTTIYLDSKTNIATITVDNINDAAYLYTIPVYLDTLMRLTQDITGTTYPQKDIKKLCVTEEKKEIIIRDISSQTESISSLPYIEEDEEDLIITEDKKKDALSKFFGMDDDEEEEESFEGGNGNNTDDSDSESSSLLASPSSAELISESSSSSSQISSPVADVTEKSMNIEIESPKMVMDTEKESEKESKKSSPKSIPKKVFEKTEKEIVDDEETLEKKLDGVSLRSYFQDKIQDLDPALIMTKKVGNYSIYSKICQTQHKRQPVILTDEELEKIQKEHKGFLRDEDIITYGSDPNKKFHYVCPRFWCLKTNEPIDPNDFEEKMENGKKVLVHPTCGKIIPPNADKVPHGHYVYEFYEPPSDNPNYKRYPGFQTGKHPKGHCLPCCFEKFLTEGRMSARRECMGEQKKKVDTEKEKKGEEKDEAEEEGEEEPEEKEELIQKEPVEPDLYIKGPEKFPLAPGRWGYLPVSIQNIFKESSTKCYVSKTNTNVKPDTLCILRYGVEINEKQSFVACISTTLHYNQGGQMLSIRDMKERIIQALTIDDFILYQNGNLVENFKTKKSYDIEKYKNTKLFVKLDMQKDEDKIYFNIVISAFENFKDYLRDDETVIDYTYLWDIVSKPNPQLFPSGLNLVIFEIPDDDPTNKVQLICPSNHYSSEFYNGVKPTLILVKQGNYYEPIYTYYFISKKNILEVEEVFREKGKISSNMKEVLQEIVRPLYKMMCKPQKSMPNQLNFKSPLILQKLMQKLESYDYTILKVVVNFNNKVIGVIARAPAPSQLFGFVPCYPSTLEDGLKRDIDYVFMNNSDIWNTYNNTVLFLKNLEKRSKKKVDESNIPCKPLYKIMEDEMIVGILTETDQFIPLSNPIAPFNVRGDLDIPTLKNENYIINPDARPMSLTDTTILTSTEEDKTRIDYVKRVKNETNFYNVFRNTIKILLNDYENIKQRKKIETEIQKDYIIYSQKLQNLIPLLKQLVGNKVQFTGDDNYYNLVDEISTCLVKNKNKCSAANICAVNNDGDCILILPEKNLLTEENNELIYYGKIADEFIRYKRIKNFMFQPNVYMPFGNIGYNLREDEILMIQSLLTAEYFDSLEEKSVNKFITNNAFDEVNPIKTQYYDSTISKAELYITPEQCQKPPSKIKATNISSLFPSQFKEVSYSKTNYCTFSFIIEVIFKKTGKKYEINEIRGELYKEYQKYLVQFKDRIVDILIEEGKKTLGDQVKANTMSFASFIYEDNYYLTTTDLWLLINRFEIPAIFMSNVNLLQTQNQNTNEDIFVGYGELTDDFVFIIVPALRKGEVPEYKVIEDDKNDIFFPLQELNETGQEKTRKAFDEKIMIQQFIENFSKKQKKKYARKLKIIEEPEIELDIEKDIDKPKSVIEDVLIVEKEREGEKPISLKEIEVEEQKESDKPTPVIEASQENKPKRPKCKKGTRRNKITGLCEPIKNGTKKSKSSKSSNSNR